MLYVFLFFLFVGLSFYIFGKSMQSLAKGMDASRNEKLAREHEAALLALERPCPICAEKIQKAAKKCIHCGEFIEPDVVASSTDARPSEDNAAVGIETTAELLQPLSEQLPGTAPSHRHDAQQTFEIKGHSVNSKQYNSITTAIHDRRDGAAIYVLRKEIGLPKVEAKNAVKHYKQKYKVLIRDKAWHEQWWAQILKIVAMIITIGIYKSYINSQN